MIVCGTGPFAGLTHGAADLLAAAQRYGADWAGGLGKQVLEAGRQAQQANAVGQRLVGQSAMAANAVDPRQNAVVHQVAGKVRAAPYTAAGLLATPHMALGALLSGHWPKVQVGDDAVQILNAPIDRPFTLGNVQFYSPTQGPDTPTHSYSGAWMRTGDHEAGHSEAMEEDVLYGLKWLDGGGWWDNNNPKEFDADRRALERARQRSKK